MVGTVASDTAEIALNGLLKDGWTIESFKVYVNGSRGSGNRHEFRCSRPLLMDAAERKRLAKRTCRNAFDWERMRP